MIVWVSTVAVAVLIGAISWWMVHHHLSGNGEPRDTDWGDWPSDQMSL